MLFYTKKECLGHASKIVYYQYICLKYGNKREGIGLYFPQYLLENG